MIQHKRLDNQVMSAKVRGKHSVDLSIAEAGTLVREYQKVADENSVLAEQVKQLEQELNEANERAPASTGTVEPVSQPAVTEVTGIFDGGKF
jgi:cell division protein FtsB